MTNTNIQVWEPTTRWSPSLFAQVEIPVIPIDDGEITPEQMQTVSQAVHEEAERRDLHPLADLFRFQQDVRQWSVRNFGDVGDGSTPLIGAVEEAGELGEALEASIEILVGPLLAANRVMQALGRLGHAHIKGKQGIRYTEYEARLKEEDAVGDVLVYLADYCQRRGIEMADALGKTWGEVRERDWIADPMGEDLGGPIAQEISREVDEAVSFDEPEG
jgi:NTP pyrophosphatase (non-canonical NTP hydrolase)